MILNVEPRIERRGISRNSTLTSAAFPMSVVGEISMALVSSIAELIAAYSPPTPTPAR